MIGAPAASRVVGTAIGQNPVAYLIPCHRVIKKVGGIGEYRWGSVRKMALIGWEASRVNVAGKEDATFQDPDQVQMVNN
jgi:AraC family transcriptional regulator of adaptative response/methylated-DNA-[protein]-cysteine methyltransferase